jgi:hypothetical protein
LICHRVEARVAALLYALDSAFPFIKEISPPLRELGAKLLYTLAYVVRVGQLFLSLLCPKVETTPLAPLLAF